ncbi:uncharacterized protein LAJ45_10598 [Morchella importuna]|uniref:uncharacterized protein n=1 Tax=Morchella importuna TaxID=1174673 RepID=UPI001E8DF435|nr:uncharacterized protein LAJ45_10598 [Morchella importuna]KAH8145318.1 hypothetical protein LAJ45_10598 [Morchella importuna]
MSSPPPPPPAAPVDDPSLQHPPAPLRLPPGIPIDPDLLQPYLGSLIHLSDSMTGVELGNINSPTTGEAQTEHQEDVTPAPYQNVELIPTDMVQPLTPSNHSTRESAPSPPPTIERPPTPASTPRIRPLPLPPSPIRHLLIRRKPLPPTTILPTHAAPTPRPTPTSHLYKDYLHKLPHTHFTEHAAPGTCLACDVTTAVTHYTCDSCGLALCSVCHYLITEDAIRGSLRLLIQHAARWKFGYSAGFLERERAEKEAEWERERVEAEREKERVKEREKERLARVVEEEDEEGGGVLVDMGEGVAEMVQRMERGRGEFPGGLVQVGMGGEGGEGEEGEEGEVEDIVL